MDQQSIKLSHRERLKITLSVYGKMFPILFRILPLLFPTSIIIVLLQAINPIIQIYITKLLVDTVVSVFNGNTTLLNHAFTLLLIQGALLILNILLLSANHLVNVKITYRVTHYFNNRLMDKILRIPYLYFEKPDFNNRLQRISLGLSYRGIEMIRSLLATIQNSITLIGLVLILVNYSWLLAIGLFLFVLPTVFANIKLGEARLSQMRKRTPDTRKEEYLNFLFMDKQAAKEFRIFGHDAYIKDKWSEKYWENKKELFKLEKWSSLISSLSGGIGIFVVVLMTLLLIKKGSLNELSVGDYVAITAAFASTQLTLNALTNYISTIYEDALFTNEIFEFYSLPEKTISTTPQPFPAPLKKGILINNLSFSYPESNHLILNNISLQLLAGQKVAIVGENGAGKSTLIKCLLGLYPAQSGTIEYDDLNINEITLESMRTNVTAAFQDFVQYHLTVKENIGIGHIQKINDESALQIAAAKADVDLTIQALAQGYNTELGLQFIGGHELSGGQWQRIALSRSFLLDSQVIILDEPTAALDPLAEAAVIDRFIELTADKTAIFISHRLGSCRNADRILVLKDGRLIEDGNHDELMKQNGEYTKMFDAQSKWYVD